MINSTLGAPLGGTTVGGQPGLESATLRLAFPAKGGGGFGICLPSIVVVAPGEPGAPVVWICARPKVATARMAASIPLSRIGLVVFIMILPLPGIPGVTGKSPVLAGLRATLRRNWRAGAVRALLRLVAQIQRGKWLSVRILF